MCVSVKAVRDTRSQLMTKRRQETKATANQTNMLHNVIDAKIGILSVI